MNGGRHDRIGLLGAGLNGYVTEEELREIYRILDKNTDIGGSDNAEQSLIDAYNNDDDEYNLGQLYNHFKENDKRIEIFNALSDYLEAKRNITNYEKFQELYKNKYNNDWFEMLEKELDGYYVDNTENIFIGIIHSLMALFGYDGRILVVNGGSTVGKSEFILTLEKLMVDFIDYGNGTPASVARRGLKNIKYFDKKIVYLGDKGLSRNTQNAQQEFAGLYQIFGGLVTEKKFKRPVTINNNPTDIHLEADGICVLYTEPYTYLKKNGAGDQYITRSTFVKLNPVKDGLKLFLEWDDSKENPFYQIHKGYIAYILNNPLELNVDSNIPIKTIVYNRCKNLRTAKYLLRLIKAYCQYVRVAEPNAEEVEKLLDLFHPEQKVTPIEQELYEMIYRNLKPLTYDEAYELLTNKESPYYEKNILKSRKKRQEKSFFTYKQIQSYFKNEMQHNTDLKDVCESEEQIQEIIQNLYNAGYLERIEEQYKNKDDLYYIVKDEKMENEKKED